MSGWIIRPDAHQASDGDFLECVELERVLLGPFTSVHRLLGGTCSHGLLVLNRDFLSDQRNAAKCLSSLTLLLAARSKVCCLNGNLKAYLKETMLDGYHIHLGLGGLAVCNLLVLQIRETK